MNENNTSSGRGIDISEIIVTIIVLVVLFFAFRYLWHGVVWAFGQYVDLLRVN